MLQTNEQQLDLQSHTPQSLLKLSGVPDAYCLHACTWQKQKAMKTGKRKYPEQLLFKWA